MIIESLKNRNAATFPPPVVRGSFDGADITSHKRGVALAERAGTSRKVPGFEAQMQTVSRLMERHEKSLRILAK
jgi:hypothetical protein